MDFGNTLSCATIFFTTSRMTDSPKPADHSQFLFYEKNDILRQPDADYKAPNLPFPIIEEEDVQPSN
jgi:hypothetical protein